MELSEGTVVAERFRLVRRLGKGGMGSVWLAHHLALDVPCALKFIHDAQASAPEVRARFEREAKAAAQIRSPHVVQVFDHGVWEGTPYIAMEYLEGEDLGKRIRRMKRLEPSEVASITSQVARALVKAHAVGLIHRDLKPGNIFLVPDDDREVAKVLDFGIAKSTVALDPGAEATQTGMLLGTPQYMSPEQARGLKTIDGRADLWSLAVVVFQCLVGQLPFNSTVLGDLLAQIIADPIPVPSTIAPVPAAFDAWWARATQRDPDLRFPNARELADALAVSLGVSMSAQASDAIPPVRPAAEEPPSARVRQGSTPATAFPAPAPPSRARRVPGWLAVAAVATCAAAGLGARFAWRTAAGPMGAPPAASPEAALPAASPEAPPPARKAEAAAPPAPRAPVVGPAASIASPPPAPEPAEPAPSTGSPHPPSKKPTLKSPPQASAGVPQKATAAPASNAKPDYGI